MRTGQVVILNGSSSAGKSTLAEAFRSRQARVGRLWWLVGLDDYLGRLPPEWHDIGWWNGTYADDGIRFVDTDDGVDILLGPVMRRVLDAYHHGVASTARAGIDVLVDEVLFDDTCWNGWLVALSGLHVTWVGVTCPTEVAQQRERDRGDRHIGLARGLSRTVHRHPHYDLEIDTSQRTVTQAVDDLSAHLDAR